MVNSTKETIEVVNVSELFQPAQLVNIYIINSSSNLFVHLFVIAMVSLEYNSLLVVLHNSNL